MSFELKHGPGNPRNSEGSFVELKDGRIMLIYTKYCGKSGGDHSAADLVSMISSDGGKTWGDETIAVRNDAKNVMSVSLLRLQDGRIALVYLKKSRIQGRQELSAAMKGKVGRITRFWKMTRLGDIATRPCCSGKKNCCWNTVAAGLPISCGIPESRWCS